MSDLFGNHIVGFPTIRLIYRGINEWFCTRVLVCFFAGKCRDIKQLIIVKERMIIRKHEGRDPIQFCHLTHVAGSFNLQNILIIQVLLLLCFKHTF